ncbi:diacylglycerol/lipid kinase family protein [Donghicola mangrovi]|uniref:Diacylglycerol kinase family lipid kinase n=1 Tax=Donghicola mangrovi TaxID=2729614 RepID=A0A850QEN5_9RHOB|nr:diacylglycerol kinase family protein [Donghicola mangrovi]NVO24599.1 diacylglycerol kinase family lipid kinase [Donghicola mangrovi]
MTAVQEFQKTHTAASVGGDVCVVLNPRSGKKDTKPETPDLCGMIQQSLGGNCEIKQVSRDASPTQLANQAIKEGYSTVIAAGGDGTIAGVATALMETDVVMGVLPMGTFNYFSRGLGLPETIPEAVSALGQSSVQTMHIGDINGRIFLNNASLGIYPTILRERESLYKKWGRNRITAYWSVLLGLAGLKRPYHLKITVDGETFEKKTALAFVANSAYQLEAFSLEGAEAVRDGELALYLTNATRWGELARHSMNLIRGGAIHGREFQLVTGQTITIEAARKNTMLIARDGEKERMTAPFKFTLRRNALNVLVPDPA